MYENYFSNIRDDLIIMVKEGPNKILDIGCGTGATSLALKNAGKADEVIGIDCAHEVRQQAEKNLDQLISGDVETLKLPFHDEYFDYVLCADVLEHLCDPWLVLKKIKRYLKKRGYLIASIPNIKNWRVLEDLIIKGKWTYVDEGILDRTHLRFFTKSSIKEMFFFAHFDIVELKGSKAEWSYKIKFANTITLGLMKNFLIGQYIVKAQRAN